jgi:hypothetical protein
MFLVAVFVGLGVVLTSVAQAEQRMSSASMLNHQAKHQSFPERWFYSLWDLDLADKLKSWKPKVEVAVCEDGLNLSRPFGNHGPVLQLSTSVPERAEYSLRAGGDSRVGVLGSDRPDAYLFLQKRW